MNYHKLSIIIFFFIISIRLGINHILSEPIDSTWSSEKFEKPFFWISNKKIDFLSNDELTG